MKPSKTSRGAPPADIAVLTVETDAAGADALAERLEARWQRPTVQLQRPNSNCAWIELYFDRDIEALLAAHAIRDWPGVHAAQPRVCRGRDWMSFWKHHFTIRDVGKRLRIQPIWEKARAAPPGRKRIWLDPGLSFGTGEHFTTRFCLEQLDRLRDRRPFASVLDVGTGSGILAIAAARLGAKRVLAFDHDAQALEQARANVRRNNVSRTVRLAVRDFVANGLPKGRFDVVCANVYSRLLIDAAPALAGACRGHLLLSGIRELELDGVADAFIAQGGREIVRDGDGEWGGLVFSWIRSSSI
ncbi:MAG TPA: 50S ribosomal protein L11 methyltransferase [Kiritimatiellia bacterium]|nr:50S ribosomal protein L11 methyltransferase [Kiritimatiellia bacterium]